MTASIIDSTKLSQAESLLWRYGITEPDEIDLPKIASLLNAQIITRRMDGSDARLIRNDAGSVISINHSTNPQRQRFSIAHEIGHLVIDFAKSGFLCTKNDIIDTESGPSPAEARANAFASQLLLPSYIFNPIFDQSKHSLSSIMKIATQFDTSITATAIKAIHRYKTPALVICHKREGIRWYFKNTKVPDGCAPSKSIQHDQPELELLFSDSIRQLRSTSHARHWLTSRDFFEHGALIESFKPQSDTLISIVSVQ